MTVELLSLERRGSASKAVLDAAKAAAAKSRLASSLPRTSATILTETRAKATLSVKGGLPKGARRRCMIIWPVWRDTVGLPVHASFAVWAKSPLTIAGIVLVIVWIAVIRMSVSGVLSAVRLRLRTRSTT